jgi:hypothetical protein
MSILELWLSRPYRAQVQTRIAGLSGEHAQYNEEAAKHRLRHAMCSAVLDLDVERSEPNTEGYTTFTLELYVLTQQQKLEILEYIKTLQAEVTAMREAASRPLRNL